MLGDFILTQMLKLPPEGSDSASVVRPWGVGSRGNLPFDPWKFTV